MYRQTQLQICKRIELKNDRFLFTVHSVYKQCFYVFSDRNDKKRKTNDYIMKFTWNYFNLYVEVALALTVYHTKAMVSALTDCFFI